MLVVHVHIHVKTESIAAFIAETRLNASASLAEPGIARFDVIQSLEDVSRFVLIEAYRDAEAPARHKETAHYATWRDKVAPMMESPRLSAKFESLYPEPERFGTPAPAAT